MCVILGIFANIIDKKHDKHSRVDGRLTINIHRTLSHCLFSCEYFSPDQEGIKNEGHGGCFHSFSCGFDNWSFSVGHLWAWKSRLCNHYWEQYWCFTKHLYARTKVQVF